MSDSWWTTLLNVLAGAAIAGFVSIWTQHESTKRELNLETLRQQRMVLGRFQEKRRELAADLLSEVYEFAQLAGHLTIYAQAGNRDSARAQYELLVPAKHRLDTAAITRQLLLDEGTSPMASLQTILRPVNSAPRAWASFMAR